MRLDVVVAHDGCVADAAHKVEPLEWEGARPARERWFVRDERFGVELDRSPPVAQPAGLRQVLTRKVLAVGGDALRDALVPIEPAEHAQDVVARRAPHGHVVDESNKRRVVVGTPR